MPTDDEQLTASPTLEPAPEREAPRTLGAFIAMAAADCVDGVPALPVETPAPEYARVTTPRRETCTRYDSCRTRSEQDDGIATSAQDVTCAIHYRDEDGWGIYVDGGWGLQVDRAFLLTLIDYCPWCGGRLA